jgi:hypothetical protein
MPKLPEFIEVMGFVAMIIAGWLVVLVGLWAMFSRPPWHRLRDTIYWALTVTGLFAVWAGFINLVQPDTLTGFVSFAVLFFLCFLPKSSSTSETPH